METRYDFKLADGTERQDFKARGAETFEQTARRFLRVHNPAGEIVAYRILRTNYVHPGLSDQLKP